jgi:hypothetical protein
MHNGAQQAPIGGRPLQCSSTRFENADVPQETTDTSPENVTIWPPSTTNCASHTLSNQAAELISFGAAMAERDSERKSFLFQGCGCPLQCLGEFFTGVFAFECSFNCLTSADFHSRRTIRFFCQPFWPNFPSSSFAMKFSANHHRPRQWVLLDNQKKVGTIR